MQTYKIDLYKRTIGFVFQFDTDCICKEFEDILGVFNDDIAELLQSEFSSENWVDCKLNLSRFLRYFMDLILKV